MIQRVAIVFDNTLRPETTGLYCRRALGNLVEVEHFLPNELGTLEPDAFDLFLNVDDGLSYPWPKHLRPSALWAIDTHLDFDRTRERIANFDFVFAAQRDGAQQLREWGHPYARWLPLACDPTMHTFRPQNPSIDIAFVGNLVSERRNALLNELGKAFEQTFVGQRYFEEMADVLNHSRIGFNCSVRNDVNMRVFEVAAMGPMLLTNDLTENGQDELFVAEKQIVTYQSDDECLDKARFYLERSDLREAIATAGRTEALARHTYLHRMTTVLRSVEKGITTKTFSVPATEEKASACLLSWKRPDNVRTIVEHLLSEPLIDDVVVWNNNPQVQLDFDSPRVKVVSSPENLVTYGRFLATQHAKHDLIYTQDDDCIVHNIKELYETFQLDPTRIAHGLKLGHLAANAMENFFESSHMALVGWGGFFKREWTDVFSQYREAYGEDNLLHRKADRLFSVLQNRRHRSIPAQVTDLDGSEGEEALSVRSDHVELTWDAVKRAMTMLNGGPQNVPREPVPINEAPQAAPYFEHGRPEVISLVNPSAKRVVDVGCGAGALGAALKERQEVEVIGVELNAKAARVACERLDRVIEGNAENLGTEEFEGTVDAVIFADILEHLRNPQQVLEQASTWLSPSGEIVASIPNVRNHMVLSSLLRGNWTYETAGLLDQDHVRFFTRNEIEKLFYRAGFKVTELLAVPGPGYEEWKASPSDEVRVGPLAIGNLAPEEAEEFYVYQYLVKSIKEKTPKNYPLTTIVIPTHNEIAFTQQCYESVRHVTDEPIEIVFVDNGSTDGTVDYLKTLDDVTVICNEENLGFPKAVNQGIDVAQGEFVLLLNNDTIVTTGWLRRMLDVAIRKPEIGILGPCSNNVSGPQQIAVQYESLMDLDGFAWRLGRQFEGEHIDFDRIVGFCMLLRKQMLDEVGGMDEQFGIGCFEDDDLTKRANQAGYRSVISKDSFVHHFGSQTFKSSGVDFAGLLASNQEKYARKWGEGARPVDSEFDVVRRSTGGLELRRKQKVLSLIMIVRDNEDTIEDCMRSIAPWVDEMIVVDTGSVDRTPEICRAYGAQIEHFTWCDDFSAARNESLKYATGEWVFWMDSDDVIPEDCGRRLRELAYQKHEPNILGYLMQVHCPGTSEDGSQEVTIVDHVKLFRNRDDLQFEMRIHEQIIPAINRARGEVRWTDIFVVHSGSDPTPEMRERKLERDFRILHMENIEKPDHPFILFNLGMTYNDAKQFDEAIVSLRRCLSVSKPIESHVAKANALLVSALSQANRHDEAWETCSSGLELFPEDLELTFRSGILHHQFGRLEESVAGYLRALELGKQRQSGSYVKGIGGHVARHNLALVYEELGQFENAGLQWEAIVHEDSAYRNGWAGYANCLRQQQEWGKMERLASRMASRGFNELAAVTKAQALEGRKSPVDAAAFLRSRLEECPEEIETLREISRIYFECLTPAEARPYLEEILRLVPDDASTLHNLGTLAFEAGEYEKAVSLFASSTEVRPYSRATWLQLGHAMKRAGRSVVGDEVFHKSLKYFGGDPELLALMKT